MGMYTLYPVLLAFLTVLSIDSVAPVELTITPADTIRTGDTVVFTCEVPSKGFLDLVRIVKYIEEENRKVTMVTNGDIPDDFKVLGRYTARYVEVPPAATLVFTITGILPEDAGRFACIINGDTPQGDNGIQAIEDIIVRVAPQYVQFRYGENTSDEEPVEDGDQMFLISNRPSTITCEVSVEGTEVYPEVRIQLDGQDVTGRFLSSRTQDKHQDSVTGLWDSSSFGEFTWDAADHDPFTPSMDGQRLECIATMEGVEPVTSYAMINMSSPPVLECENSHVNAALGTPDVRLTCIGRMKPAPVDIRWNIDIISGDNPPLVVDMQDRSGGEYEFSLEIAEVLDLHYKEYILTVGNGVGESEGSITLLREGGESPTESPAQPEPEVDSEEIDDEGVEEGENSRPLNPPEQQIEDDPSFNGSAVHVVSGVLVTITLLLCALVSC